jgi:hypothetical protein
VKLGTHQTTSFAASSQGLERAVTAAAAATVGGGVSRGGLHAPRSKREQLFEAVGIRYAEHHASNLVGLSRGVRRPFGSCVEAGRTLTFEYWFPHLGIAVDLQPVAEGDVLAKQAWCEPRAIMYFSPAALTVPGPDGHPIWSCEPIKTLADERRATQVAA